MRNNIKPRNIVHFYIYEDDMRLFFKNSLRKTFRCINFFDVTYPKLLPAESMVSRFDGVSVIVNYKCFYGDDFDKIKKPTDIFCVAFSEYPHQIDVLYDGPSNGGAANLLYNTPTGYKATMTCYAYDDLESWRGNFPKEILQQQFKLVADKWKTGMPLVKEAGEEIYDISYISYSLFRSAYNQISFVMLREKLLAGENVKADIIKIVKSELEVAENVYKIMRRRSEVGFEEANHYYYSCDNVLEKVLNCEYLLDYYLRP